jgi:hypothetical protein
MIDLRETHYPTGTEAVILGLATATVRVSPIEVEGKPYYEVRTSRRSNGSVRYTRHASYEAAVEYATGYAKRIAKQKIEREAQKTRAILRETQNLNIGGQK